MDEALWALLTGAAPVAAICGQRIYWGVAPQDAKLPFVVMTVVSDTDHPHMQGAGGFSQYRVQVDSFGADRPAARTLARAVKGQVNGTRAGEIRLILFAAEREVFESGAIGRPFGFSQDYIVTWRPDHG